MDTDYQDNKTAKSYIDFINSKNGIIQQETVFGALIRHLRLNDGDAVLDAACGTGWLGAKLTLRAKIQVHGCDFSRGLLDYGKTHYQGVEFQQTDLTKSLPYPDSYFNSVILNMAAHDLNDLPKAFSEISRVSKPNAQFLMTIANPYYSFPVGVWKRGLFGFLLRRKPALKIRPFYKFKRKKSRQFAWNGKFSSYFYTLAEYINIARRQGFGLTAMEELKAQKDGKNFDMNYQLYRFPILLLLKFKKTSE